MTRHAHRALAFGRVVLGVVALLASGLAAASIAHELHVLRLQEARLQRGLDHTLRDRSTAVNGLRLAEDHIALIARRLVGSERKARVMRARIRVLHSRVSVLRRRERRERAVLKRQALAAYRVGRAGPLKLFFEQRSPQEAQRLLMEYRYILRAQAHEIAAARVTLGALMRTETLIRARALRLALLVTRERRQERHLRTALTQRAALVHELNRRARSGHAQLVALRARAKRLQALMRGLRRLSRKAPPIPSLSGPFARFRGRLPLPIPARFATLHAASAHGLGRWRGVVLPGHPGEEVRAVFPGRVVYANWLRGYGLLLILDNGDGYMTLYGHNQTLLKRVGDTVKGGEVIATVGTSGGFSRPGLYFDLSHDGQPLNPLAWFAH